jgi:hypothetical protein
MRFNYFVAMLTKAEQNLGLFSHCVMTEFGQKWTLISQTIELRIGMQHL